MGWPVALRHSERRVSDGFTYSPPVETHLAQTLNKLLIIKFSISPSTDGYVKPMDRPGTFR